MVRGKACWGVCPTLLASSSSWEEPTSNAPFLKGLWRSPQAKPDSPLGAQAVVAVMALVVLALLAYFCCRCSDFTSGQDHSTVHFGASILIISG